MNEGKQNYFPGGIPMYWQSLRENTALGRGKQDVERRFQRRGGERREEEEGGVW